MKYGFVYIWYDRKHKRYYVGCRWGNEHDGYICSSSWMKASYKKRPQDFKRRILARVYTNRNDLHEEEYRWLSMMKPDELHGPRYYNIRNHHFSHWSSDSNRHKTISEKISNTLKTKHTDPEYRKIYEAGQLKRDYTQTLETRKKRRVSLLGKNKGKDTTRASIASAAARRGRPITKEHKQKIKDAASFKNLNSKKVKCKYCDFIGNPGNIGRYHNEKCKHR